MKAEKYIEKSFDNFDTFLKWVGISIIIGIIVGFIGVLFHFAIEHATEFRIENSKIILLLPLGGAFIAWIYKFLDMENDKGTNFVISAVRDNDTLKFKTAPLIFISTD